MEDSNLNSVSTEESKHPAYESYKNINPIKVYKIGVHKIEIEERYVIKQSSLSNKNFIKFRLITIFCIVAQGAFGYIFSVEDTVTSSHEEEKKLLAIKKIENPFEHKLFARRTLRELKLLRLLKHENVFFFFFNFSKELFFYS